ncbi:MAG: hypothetical protein Q8942_16935 [Bacillota bacterium]|nr:hypothetical protein [Bacillota bacterium]
MNNELKSSAKEYIENVESPCLLMLEGLNLRTKKVGSFLELEK